MLYSPVSGAFKPVEDVSAAGVINLIIRMGVGLLHCHRVTGTTWKDRRVTSDTRSTIPVCECVSTPPTRLPIAPISAHSTMWSSALYYALWHLCVLNLQVLCAERNLCSLQANKRMTWKQTYDCLVRSSYPKVCSLISLRFQLQLQVVKPIIIIFLSFLNVSCLWKCAKNYWL